MVMSALKAQRRESLGDCPARPFEVLSDMSAGPNRKTPPQLQSLLLARIHRNGLCNIDQPLFHTSIKSGAEATSIGTVLHIPTCGTADCKDLGLSPVVNGQ